MKSKMIIVVAMFVLAASVLPAAADVIVNVNAVSQGQTATQQFVIPSSANLSDWTLPSSTNLLTPDGVYLGSLTSMAVKADNEAYVNLFFGVIAGSSDTTFSVTATNTGATGSGPFTPIVNPTAFATAGITLTSDFDGATITGLFPGAQVYEARYTGLGGNTLYADLVNGLSITPDKTVTNSDRLPALGVQTIADTVSGISLAYDFTLSAFDQASGTGRFEVDAATPEPATMSLLVMGGMAVLARRKRTMKSN